MMIGANFHPLFFTRGRIVAVGDVFGELLPTAASLSRRHGPESAALARIRDFGETVIVVPSMGDRVGTGEEVAVYIVGKGKGAD